MDDILPTLLSWPSDAPIPQQEHEKRVTAYVKKVGGIPSEKWTASQDGATILDILDPDKNSIPYTIALLENLKATRGNEAQAITLLPYIADFFQSYSPSQIKHVGKQWRELFALTADAYGALGVKDIQPLAVALVSLKPTGSTLTTSHLVYLRLCLQLALPSRALPVLDKNIYAFPGKGAAQYAEDSLEDHERSDLPSSLTGPINAEVVLEYYILGGMVYISQRNWVRAQLFLEFAVLYPTPHGSASALQVEAYQKWVLVTLMLDGKATSHSWPTSQQAIKHIRAVGKAYEALADCFQKRDWRKYQAEADAGEEIWLAGGNARLVKLVGETLLQYCVLDLQRTFTALPVSRVAAHLGSTPEQAMQLLTDLISTQRLAAQLDTTTQDPTLRFDSTSDTIHVDDTAIAAQTARIEELIEQVKDASRRLMLTKDYAEATRKAKRNDGDPADQMDLDWTNSMVPTGSQLDDDEDIMA